MFAWGCLFKPGLELPVVGVARSQGKIPRGLRRSQEAVPQLLWPQVIMQNKSGSCSLVTDTTNVDFNHTKWEWRIVSLVLLGSCQFFSSPSKIWPYGEGECAGQGRRHSSHMISLSILAFQVTLMKIALALEGKEQVDKATLPSKMGTETLICFLCGDHRWQSWPFMNSSYGQVCRA